jgi:hypothetical protein
LGKIDYKITHAFWVKERVLGSSCGKLRKAGKNESILLPLSDVSERHKDGEVGLYFFGKFFNQKFKTVLVSQCLIGKWMFSCNLIVLVVFDNKY